MGRRASSSSSSTESSTYFGFSGNVASSSSSSSLQRDLSTELRLGLSISYTRGRPSVLRQAVTEEENECNGATFYDLIRTLELMFNTDIIWAEMDGDRYEKYGVLTYEDREGDWMMVGDVPWEMFLSAVRRLKITKC
ncbi:hypothetical protein HRI_003769700 [Hibiscus trionum]|uniref:Auxin-responsive protein n=1 Tax=Hibiscus trionum TaxID=183268 RepID=A0A9W7IRX6_HIBTR|nr:hypothetical protein HRI_003769700 [Hibiscus trionum]